MILSGFASVYLVWANADLPNKHPNGFNRHFLQTEAVQLFETKLPEDSRGIVGKINGRLLVSSQRANKYYTVDNNGRFYQENIPLESSTVKYLDKHFQLFCSRSGNLQITSQRLPFIFQYSLSVNRANKIAFRFGPYLYMQLLNDNNFLLQKLDGNGNSFIMYRFPEGSSKVVKHFSSPVILENDISTDGQLVSDPISNKIGFMHYYKNRVLVLDSMLKLSRIINTIDTITNSLKYKSDGPRLSTNQKSCLHNNILYISSNLKADNESRKEYMKNIPIDCYNIVTGEYLGTFYIPLKSNSLIRSMYLTKENELAILYHNKVVALFNLINHK